MSSVSQVATVDTCPDASAFSSIAFCLSDCEWRFGGLQLWTRARMFLHIFPCCSSCLIVSVDLGNTRGLRSCISFDIQNLVFVLATTYGSCDHWRRVAGCRWNAVMHPGRLRRAAHLALAGAAVIMGVLGLVGAIWSLATHFDSASE